MQVLRHRCILAAITPRDDDVPLNRKDGMASFRQGRILGDLEEVVENYRKSKEKVKRER